MDAIENGDVAEDSLVPLREAQMHLPMKIGGYSDFFCSLEHCQNVSKIEVVLVLQLLKQNAVQPNDWSNGPELFPCPICVQWQSL